MKFDVIAYREYTCCDKVYLTVEADNLEEAKKLAEANPDDYEVDYKGLDVVDLRWIDKDEWLYEKSLTKGVGHE